MISPITLAPISWTLYITSKLLFKTLIVLSLAYLSFTIHYTGHGKAN